MEQKIVDYGKVLWDYLCLCQPLKKVDCLLVFGGHDPSVAKHAANLYKQGYSNNIIISGGNIHPAKFYGNDTDLIEAKAIKKVMIREGIPEKAIILEKSAKNTSENFWYTADLIKGKKLEFDTFILVQKPYTERRTFLTGLNRWKDKTIIISSITYNYNEYLNSGIDKEKIINMMTGEIYRLQKYPDLGYFDRPVIPENVLLAYQNLIDLGFNKRIDKQII